METLKQIRIISILKIILFSILELAWCLSGVNAEKIFFIVLIAVLILYLLFKIIFLKYGFINVVSLIFLTISWFIEIILTTILLILLYYIIGFDLYDIASILVTIFIIVFLSIEVAILIKFIESNIK